MTEPNITPEEIKNISDALENAFCDAYKRGINHGFIAVTVGIALGITVKVLIDKTTNHEEKTDN